MKTKYRILIILSVLIVITFSSGLTYSFFHSKTTMNANNKNIAKFIFNTNELDSIDLPLKDLKPGFHESYPFLITNSKESIISDVTIDYKLSIKTFHLVPLVIKLYSVTDEGDSLLLTCDESYTRDEITKEIICNYSKTMEHSNKQVDNYKLDVEFPNSFNGTEYSNLVDYINIDITSSQKIGG